MSQFERAKVWTLRPLQKEISVIFLNEELHNELVWVVRCKDCGEFYVLREVKAGEVRYPQPERISCQKTGMHFQYLPNEFETLWAS